MDKAETIALQECSSQHVVEDNDEESNLPELPNFFEYSSNVDMHGYSHVSRERGVRKALWCILFVAAFVFSVIMFRDAVTNYLNYAVYMETKDFKFPDNDMNFPTITICNKIPLIKQSYERVKKIVDITPREFEEFYTRYLTRYRDKVPPNIPVETKIIEAFTKQNITTPEQAFNLFEINHEEMFGNSVAKLFLTTKDGNPDYPTCRFDYRERCDTKPMMSKKESTCHQINFFEENKEPRKGWRYGAKKFGNMIAVVNTATSERFNKTLKLRSVAPYMDLIEGLVVYIHSYGKMHENSPVTERIFLSTGKWHFLKIDYTEVYHLPPPYPYQCGKRKYKRINNTRFRYTKSMCILDCIIGMKYEECGCIGWEFRGLVDLPVCNITQIHCVINNSYYAKLLCEKKDCPNDCVYHKYNVHVETLDIINDNVYDRAAMLPDWKLNRSETKQFIRTNLVGIQVMYTNVAKLEYHLAIVTWKTLIGTIGGNLGLCTGFSIIVVFEFIQYAVDYLKLLVKIRKKTV